MKENRQPLFRAAVTLVLALVLAACAATTPKQPAVEERAQARWDAHLAGDLGAVYEYLSPARRTSISSLAYQRSLLRRQIGYTSAEVLGSDCLEDSCKIQILIGIKVNRPVPGVDVYEGEQEIEENWIRSEGNWWYVPKK